MLARDHRQDQYTPAEEKLAVVGLSPSADLTLGGVPLSALNDLSAHSARNGLQGLA